MNKELENEVVEEEVDTTTEVEMSDEEKQARASGWRPKEEFEGDPGKWVDAGEFNRRGEFYEAIKAANTRAKMAEERLTALEQHHKKVAQVEYEKAINTLREERRKAARENDLEGVIAADERLTELEKEAATNIPQESSGRNSELEAFARDNEWYGHDSDMTVYANGIGAMLERDHPNMSTTELLRQVKEKTEKFFNLRPSKPTASAVASTRTSVRTGSPAVKKRITYKDLPDEAKDVYNKLVKSPRNPRGIMESEQYLREYAAISGLPYEE